MSQQFERIVTFLWGSWCLQGSQKSAQGSQHFNDDFLAFGSSLHSQHCGWQHWGSQHCGSQHVSVGQQGLHISSNGDWHGLLIDSKPKRLHIGSQIGHFGMQSGSPEQRAGLNVETRSLLQGWHPCS